MIFQLAITNKTRSPVQIEEGQIFLVADSNRYTEDLNAERQADQQSFLVSSEQIQPGATLTGHVVFDLPGRASSSYREDGNLFILPFGANGDTGTATQRGVFRTFE